MRHVFVLVAVAAMLGMGLSGVGGAEAPARAAQTVAAKSTRQVIGDWVVTCAPAVAAHESCIMSQTLSSEKLKKPIAVFSIGKDHSGKLKGSLRIPVGVSLPAGVVVGIEKQNPFIVPYAACHRIGCFAAFDLTEPLLGQIKRATKITVVAQSISRQALSLNFSTRGFPSAYEAYLKGSK